MFFARGCAIQSSSKHLASKSGPFRMLTMPLKKQKHFWKFYPPAFKGGFVMFQKPMIFIEKTRVQAVKYRFFRYFRGKLAKENPEKDAKIQDFTYTADLGSNSPKVWKLGFIGCFFLLGRERKKTCSTIIVRKNQGILHACSFSGSLSRRCIHAVALVLSSFGRSLDVNGTQDALADVVLGADALQFFFCKLLSSQSELLFVINLTLHLAKPSKPHVASFFSTWA